MSSDPGEAEVTQLIDVSDVETSFDDEPETGRGEDLFSEPMPSGPSSAEGPMVAGLKDRFAAFTVDLICLYVIYWFMMITFRAIAIGDALGPVPVSGLDGLIFHGLFLLIALIWFVIPEMAFAGSVGKLFCGLTIRKKDGEYPSFMPALVRNILRPVDILLFIFFIMAAAMEWGKWHRRLGDVLAGTIVLKKIGRSTRRFALSMDMIPSVSSRVLAFMIDFAMFILFGFGLALLLTPDEPLFSELVVVLAPVLFVMFFALPEWLTWTSPGKWIYGFSICHEDGTSIGLSSALVRTLWRVFDFNPLGFFTALFSIRRQRAGDTAAGTVVMRAPREWKGLIGLAAVSVVFIATLYAGLANRDNFLGGNFEVNFLPSIDAKGLKLKSGKPIQANLVTANFRFAAGDPSQTRTPSTFDLGETLYLIFDVTSYSSDKGRVWLQEDMEVRYPDDSVGLKIENINEFRQEMADEGPIRFENSITIPENAVPGRYTVTVTVRDRIFRQEIKEQRFFYVNAPLPKALPEPKAPEMAPEPPDFSPPPPPQPSIEGVDRPIEPYNPMLNQDKMAKPRIFDEGFGSGTGEEE